MQSMGTRIRPVDRGSATAKRQRTDLGRELRDARMDRGLSSRVVADAIGCSHSSVLRIERGEVVHVSLLMLNRMAAVVGLDLSTRLFPGGPPVRDNASLRLLELLRLRLHPRLTWRVEVPLPNPGDQRAFDALIRGTGWREAVEAETGPRDTQALARRLELKVRDGQVDGMILLLPNTRRIRDFLRTSGPTLRTILPLDGSIILQCLGAGIAPGGSGIVLL
jgi:transcriptional regulator with XRE-family HTH domain